MSERGGAITCPRSVESWIGRWSRHKKGKRGKVWGLGFGGETSGGLSGKGVSTKTSTGQRRYA